MRTWLAVAVAAVQVAVLGFMALEREWIARTGQTILLRTAPVDPRDPMRGEYVRFGYEISTVPRALWRDGVATWTPDGQSRSRPHRNARVYATLHIGTGGLAELVSLSDRQPDSGLFLRGRVDWAARDAIQVRYGVEALFVQQGASRAFEAEARGDKAGVPVNTEVAVSPRGLGVLKGYRWEPLGLRMTLERREEPPRQPGMQPRRAGVISATIELKNHGDTPLAIVDRAGGRSFRLVEVDRRWNDREQAHRWVGGDSATPPVRPEEVVVVQPGQTHQVRIDLTRPEWFVVSKDGRGIEREPVALEALEDDWRTQFRFDYVPPTAEECAALPQLAAMYRLHLRSQAFNPGG